MRSRILFSSTVCYDSANMTIAETARHPDLINPDLEHYAHTLKNRIYCTYPFAEPLFATLEHNFPEAAFHCERTAIIATVTAMSMDLGDADIHRASVSGLLHDIGKSDIPEDVRYGTLSEEQRLFVRTLHMDAARDLLRDSDCPPDILHIIMSHHDAFPGSGLYRSGQIYPRLHSPGYEGPERRKTHDPQTQLLTRLVWLADKTDRDVNGYEGRKRKSFDQFDRDFHSNYDPVTYSGDPKLFAAAREAVRRIFYPLEADGRVI